MAKLLTIIDLENGLQLKLYDHSRKLAGDRWLVSLTAVIDIPLDGVGVDAANKAGVDPAELKQAVGEKICYKQKMQRHFIDGAQKDQVLRDLMNSFLASTRPYLAHRAFAEKVVVKAYREHLKKKAFSAVKA